MGTLWNEANDVCKEIEGIYPGQLILVVTHLADLVCTLTCHIEDLEEEVRQLRIG